LNKVFFYIEKKLCCISKGLFWVAFVVWSLQCLQVASGKVTERKTQVIESQTKSIASWKEEQHLTLVEIAGSEARLLKKTNSNNIANRSASK